MSELQPGDPIRIEGFINDFGSAPEDFRAISIRDASEVKAHLVLVYAEENAVQAITALSEAGLELDLESVTRQKLSRAGILTDLSELEANLLIAPASEEGIYSIVIDRSVEVYTHYADFQAALQSYIDAGRGLIRCDAQGSYDSLGATLTSKRIRIRMNASDES